MNLIRIYAEGSHAVGCASWCASPFWAGSWSGTIHIDETDSYTPHVWLICRAPHPHEKSRSSCGPFITFEASIVFVCHEPMGFGAGERGGLRRMSFAMACPTPPFLQLVAEVDRRNAARDVFPEAAMGTGNKTVRRRTPFSTPGAAKIFAARAHPVRRKIRFDAGSWREQATDTVPCLSVTPKDAIIAAVFAGNSFSHVVPPILVCVPSRRLRPLDP